MQICRLIANFVVMNNDDGKVIVADIRQADVNTSLELAYADSGIRAGFPSPAEDYVNEKMDLNRELVSHPAATFYGRVVGDSMSGEGIDEDDLIIIDKSLIPENGDLAVCCLDGEFTLKRLRLEHDRVWLMPSNPAYSPIEVTSEMDFKVWGVVTHTIKSNRRPVTRKFL